MFVTFRTLNESTLIWKHSRIELNLFQFVADLWHLWLRLNTSDMLNIITHKYSFLVSQSVIRVGDRVKLYILVYAWYDQDLGIFQHNMHNTRGNRILTLCYPHLINVSLNLLIWFDHESLERWWFALTILKQKHNSTRKNRPANEQTGNSETSSKKPYWADSFEWDDICSHTIDKSGSRERNF